MSGVGVVSLEVTREPREALATAVSEAATSLGSALSAYGKGGLLLGLVAASAPVPYTSRVAAYRAERNKLWASLQHTGTTLPEGRRVEIRVEHDDASVRYVGGLVFKLSQLPVALEVTGKAAAICIAWQTPHLDLPLDELIRPFMALPPEPESFLKQAVSNVADRTLVMRAFGTFDDRAVGSEVFALDDDLDLLEPLVRREADAARP